MKHERLLLRHLDGKHTCEAKSSSQIGLNPDQTSGKGDSGGRLGREERIVFSEQFYSHCDHHTFWICWESLHFIYLLQSSLITHKPSIPMLDTEEQCLLIRIYHTLANHERIDLGMGSVCLGFKISNAFFNVYLFIHLLF